MEVNELPILKCPDEEHPVSQAVHLARLATGYPACIECPHRHDSAALPEARRRVELAEQRSRNSIFRTNGIRGLYCNDLTREVMVRLGSAVASLLWEEPTRRLPKVPEAGIRRTTVSSTLSSEPRVVVGYDDRFSSPDLAIGLVQSLRRGGCAVVDIGSVHRPMLDFAVDHFHADAGCLVTGGGCPGDWNGLDLVSRGGLPWSRHGRLSELEKLWQSPLGRPSRVMSPCRTVAFRQQYLEIFRKQFHALRPFRIQVVTACAQTSLLLASLLEHFPGQMSFQTTPRPCGEEDGDSERLHQELVHAIHREHLDLGFLITSDGRACHVFDECGELLSPEEMTIIMLETGEECPENASHLVVPSGLDEQFQRLPLKLITSAESTEESLLETQLLQRALLATDLKGRYWRASSSPRCDALLTFASVLQFFSRSDLPPSLELKRRLP